MRLDAQSFLADLRRIVDRIERLTPADVASEKNDIVRDHPTRIENRQATRRAGKRRAVVATQWPVSFETAGPAHKDKIRAVTRRAISPLAASTHESGHVAHRRRRALRLGWPMKSAARSAHVGTMIWTSRAALGADSLIAPIGYNEREERHRAGP